MNLSKFYNKPPALDISDWKQRGAELKQAIIDAVEDTQRVVVRSYPDRIIMTTKQYNMLRPEMSEPIEYAGQEFYLYRTKYNVMEVEIKDALIIDLGAEVEDEQSFQG